MPQLRCPTCDAPVDSDQSPAMPFCSVRCKQIDLGRWINEEIGIPLEPEDREGREVERKNDEEQDDL